MMKEYGDSTFQTINEIDLVTKDSPLKQVDSNFNMMYSVIEYYADGSLGPADIKGYLELNLV